MNNAKYLEFMNLGAEEKRKGNFAGALKYYNLAKQNYPCSTEVYYELGKLHFGLGNFELAIKNFLVQTHYGIHNYCAVNRTIDANLIESISLEYTSLPGLLPDELAFNPDWMKRLEDENSLLNLLLFQDTLFWTGCSFIAQNHLLKEHYQITDSHIQDLQKAVLTNGLGGLLQNERYINLLGCVGFMVLVENHMLNIAEPHDIETFYLGKHQFVKSPFLFAHYMN